MKKLALKTVFLDTVPVLTGYLFLGIGFGILLNETGYGVLWSFCMGTFIFAGSCQYLALSLLASKASLISAAIATLLVNARHIFYGISLLDTYKGAGKKKPYLIFALTDETYSLVSKPQVPEGVNFHSYCLTVSLFDQIYWVSGTALGALVGTLLPAELEGIEFVLTALFVTIFTEQWLSTKNHRPALIGVAGTLLCLWIFGRDIFLIPSMAVIAVTLTVMSRTKKEDSHG